MNIPSLKMDWVFRFIRKIFTPPKHMVFDAYGSDAYECLRSLEKQAKLPISDLRVDYNSGLRVASFPAGHRATRYNIYSTTSNDWKNRGQDGYICGSLLEADVPVGTVRFSGSLNISKNCPGVFKNNRCTTCGIHA